MNNSLYSAQEPVNILSNVINQYMTTSTIDTSNNERKRKIDPNCGQSLTAVEVLAQLPKKRQNQAAKSPYFNKKRRRKVVLKESGQYSPIPFVHILSSCSCNNLYNATALLTTKFRFLLHK